MSGRTVQVKGFRYRREQIGYLVELDPGRYGAGLLGVLVAPDHVKVVTVDMIEPAPGAQLPFELPEWARNGEVYR